MKREGHNFFYTRGWVIVLGILVIIPLIFIFLTICS